MSHNRRQQRLAEFIAPFRVKPDSRVTFGKDFDPSFKEGVKKKKEGVALLAEGVRLLSEYQARLAAQDTWGVLVVLQGLDSAGKDGAIRHVMSGVNPQGVSVHSFKVPSAEELDHDFLWRYARALPGRGEIGIFNRSHYEEVLVVRVHPENPRPPEAAARQRGRATCGSAAIARSTTGSATSPRMASGSSSCSSTSRRRSSADASCAGSTFPTTTGSSPAADVRERELWDDYQKAFSQMLSHTSTEWAPWYVIPSDRKWFARIGVGGVLVHALMEIDPRYPRVTKQQRESLLEVKEHLEADAPKGADADPFEQE